MPSRIRKLSGHPQKKSSRISCCKNFLESIKNCISSLFWATIFYVGLQRDRDILKYIVGMLKYIKVYPRVKIGKNPTFLYILTLAQSLTKACAETNPNEKLYQLPYMHMVKSHDRDSFVMGVMGVIWNQRPKIHRFWLI